MTSSRGSSWPRDQTQVSGLAGGFFTAEPLRKPLNWTYPWANSMLVALGLSWCTALIPRENFRSRLPGGREPGLHTLKMSKGGVGGFKIQGVSVDFVLCFLQCGLVSFVQGLDLQSSVWVWSVGEGKGQGYWTISPRDFQPTIQPLLESSLPLEIPDNNCRLFWQGGRGFI